MDKNYLYFYNFISNNELIKEMEKYKLYLSKYFAVIKFLYS